MSFFFLNLVLLERISSFIFSFSSSSLIAETDFKYILPLSKLFRQTKRRTRMIKKYNHVTIILLSCFSNSEVENKNYFSFSFSFLSFWSKCLLTRCKMFADKWAKRNGLREGRKQMYMAIRVRIRSYSRICIASPILHPWEYLFRNQLDRIMDSPRPSKSILVLFFSSSPCFLF